MAKEISNKQIVKAFLFTVEEYKRFADFFAVSDKHSLLDGYNEEEYVAVQTKLMVLRKYSYNRDAVYVPKVIEAGQILFPQMCEALEKINKKYIELEKNQLHAVLSDGTKLTLYQMQECIIYGMYLHADEDKIEKILNADATLCFSMTRKFVEEIQIIIFEIYDLLAQVMEEKYVKGEAKKASVIYTGEIEGAVQEITGSSYWSNLYGRDATNEEVIKIFNDGTDEDRLILIMSIIFLNELKKENYSVEVLENLVFPPTRSQWGDFLQISIWCKEQLSKMGYSSKVRYNDKHDIAYVHLFPNVEDAFILDQPHVIKELIVVNFVYESDRYGWRIFSIGERLEKYKENISIGELIRQKLRRE